MLRYFILTMNFDFITHLEHSLCNVGLGLCLGLFCRNKAKVCAEGDCLCRMWTSDVLVSEEPASWRKIGKKSHLRL